MEYWNAGILGVRAEINHFNYKKRSVAAIPVESSRHRDRLPFVPVLFYKLGDAIV